MTKSYDKNGYVYWTGAELKFHSRRIDPGFLELRDKPIVDLCYSTEEPDKRYGRYTSADWIWRHVPLEKFPKEFRMHLLLEGIP